MRYAFDSDTQVEQIAEHRWQGVLSDAWNIGSNPNGGYLNACCTAALNACLPHPDAMAQSTHFLRPGVSNAGFEVHTEVLKVGRTASTGRASLWQDGKLRLELTATYADLQSMRGPHGDFVHTPPELPPPEQCVERSADAQGVALPLLNRLEIRIHPQHARAGENTEMEISGWIRCTDGREPDPRLLALFVDAFPPSPFAKLGVVGWVPTVELTTHIRTYPHPGWVQAHLKTTDLLDGRMIENGRLWDSQGTLVAQSRQLGLLQTGT